MLVAKLDFGRIFGQFLMLLNRHPGLRPARRAERLQAGGGRATSGQILRFSHGTDSCLLPLVI